MPLSSGYILKDRYRIEALLRQGGIGAVYRAWDILQGMSVAIKENLDAWPEAGKQFQQEAKILARLSHPSLPVMRDFFFIENQGQYLVLDYVEGEDLATVLKRKGSVAEGQALEWISQVCDGLSYLHGQSPAIIHGDIKPASIKVRADGGAMLVDFGISKIHDPLLRTSRAHTITPGYSPPEQYSGHTTDERSDIYALGATLFTMLTGVIPPESIYRVHKTEEMPLPRSLDPHVSPGVEQAVLKATEISAQRRFQSVEEFQAALLNKPEAGSARIVTLPTPEEEQSVEQDTHQEIADPPQIRRAPVWVFSLIGAVIVLCLVFGGLLLFRSRSVFDALLVEATPASSSANQPANPLPSSPTTPMDLLVTASPTPGGIYIPTINAWVSSLHFYEGSQENMPPKNIRVYAERFPVTTTRTVYWELSLTHPTADEQINFSIRSVLADSGGTELDDYEIDTYREDFWTYSWHTSGWGWEEPGLWQAGVYTVELYIDELLVASGTFEIYP